MAKLDLNEATNLFLERMPERTGFNTDQLYSGVWELFEDPLGGVISEQQKGQIRGVLQLNGYDYRPGKGVPKFRVLFASTRRWGLCPEDIWLASGGTLETLRQGNFIRVPEPSKSIVRWWENDDSSAGNGPDWFGRPRTGKQDSEIDAILRTAKADDGSVSLADAIRLFDLEGSKPRDRRARARVFLGQSKSFQSLRDGRYYDVEDPRLPPDVRDALVTQYISDWLAQTQGLGIRLFKLGAAVPDWLSAVFSIVPERL